jgi:hypothetical protein
MYIILLLVTAQNIILNKEFLQFLLFNPFRAGL